MLKNDPRFCETRSKRSVEVYRVKNCTRLGLPLQAMAGMASLTVIERD